MTLRNNTEKTKFLFIQVTIIAYVKKKNIAAYMDNSFLGLGVRNPPLQEQKAKLRPPALLQQHNR